MGWHAWKRENAEAVHYLPSHPLFKGNGQSERADCPTSFIFIIATSSVDTTEELSDQLKKEVEKKPNK